MKCDCKYFQDNYPNCTYCSDNNRILVSENKRKYILNNISGRQVCKIRIDNCVINDQSKCKCDYLIIVCNTDTQENIYFFIELKGKDLIGAVEQLTQTIEDFKHNINGKMFARVVLSKVSCPRSIETDARVHKLKKMLKSYGGNFEYSSIKYERDKI